MVRAARPVLCIAAIGVAACGNPPPDTVASSAAQSPTTSSASCAALAGITGQLDDRGAQPRSGSSLTMTAGDSYFSPTCLTGVGAGTVTLKITNTGTALHNITVDAQGIDSDIPARQSVTMKVAVAAGAPLTFFCKYHRASGMQGALVPGG